MLNPSQIEFWILTLEPYHDNSEIIGLYASEEEAEAEAESQDGPSWRKRGSYQVTKVYLGANRSGPVDGHYRALAEWPRQTYRPPEPYADEPGWIVGNPPVPAGYFAGYGTTPESAKLAALKEAKKSVPSYTQGMDSRNSSGRTMLVWRRG